ncbi:hypothetical protein [Actinomyces polynesiensis]|uniref:hypothetical protein n=1 Tax=Actinomyces polynesiensis TaxID=1325934 RepID=UPI000694552B|nr:hypothetical protein [Actinomyces polynesiensis]
MTVILVAVGATVALFGLDRLLLWAEARGWIFYRRRKPDGTGAVLDPVFDVLDPSHVHLVEEQEHQRVVGVEDSTKQDIDPITGLPRS